MINSVIPAICLLLGILVQDALTQDTVSAMCQPNELCTTAKRCEDSDDSGKKGIGPRIARFCGTGLMCCEAAQLESWDEFLANQPITQSIKGAPGIRNKAGRVLEPKPNEICGVDMECVPRRLCRDNTIIDDGHTLINPRIGTSVCSRSLHRCCAVDQQVDESNSPYVAKQKDFKYRSCGWSNPQGLIPDNDKFNYTEDVAIFGQYPWMVGIFTGRQKFLCGGTLIHPQLVITTSHNIVNETVDTLVARMGDWDLNSLNEPYIHESRRIKEIIMHPEFEGEKLYNDIALLLLDEPVQMAPHIQPLCLPPSESPKLIDQLEESTCIATGWGTKAIDSEQLENVLKRIELPFVEHDECQAMLRSTLVGARFRLRPSFLCAGGVAGKDTCKGDGGSPLFCTMPGQQDRFQLVGMVSWGVKCAVEDIPAVYTNVPYLRNWVDEKIKGLGLSLQDP